jgi:tRNA-2-methylthio-N6-dimethylallyladenosine synthase
MQLVKKIKFINSYSFIFSSRPGTVASNLKLIDTKVAKKRLNLIQSELFSYQSSKNKMTENKIVNVLVENKIKNQNKFFGRTECMTAVIFDGEENIEGQIVPVLITHSNQNNLFGEIKLNKDIKAA